jgi:poly(3-hydroxybutyrate) depolymerase
MNLRTTARSPRWPAAVLCAFLFAANAQLYSQEKSKAGQPAVRTQSRIEKRTYDFKEAGKEMEYALFIPSQYDKTKKTPLMVALHGLYTTPQQIMRYPRLTDLAEEHGYIVVAPMGYNSQGWYGNKPPIARKPQPENLYELSEKDVMNVLAIVRKEYTIDPDRIYLMGHSMGGGGTFHIAINNPDLFAALAPIAPAVFHKPTNLEKIKHVPVILVQGDKDNLVRVDQVRPWAEKMKGLKMTYEYVEVNGGNHINVAFNNLPKIFEFFDRHRKSAKTE